jgi:hypothetical protein
MAEQEQNINLEEESELKMNYYAECNDQLANLNNYCADLNQKLHGVNINEKVDILGKNRIILTGMAANFESDISEDTGVDLITIRQQEQKQILEDMINKDFTDDDTEINEEAFEIKYDDNTKNSINITNKNKMKKAKKHKNVSKCEKRRKRAISKKRRMRRH